MGNKSKKLNECMYNLKVLNLPNCPFSGYAPYECPYLAKEGEKRNLCLDKRHWGMD